MKRAGLLWIAATAIAVVLSGCSNTQGTNPPSSENSAARPGAVGSGGAGANVREDDDFVRDVALKNIAEIELSRMALGKTANAEIKAFAQQMVDDHTAAGDKLKGVVSGEPIAWPAQVDEKHRKAAAELATKSGREFDEDFVKAMVEGHQDLAAKLESRLDVQSVSDWKTAAAGRTHSNALPEPGTALRDVQVRPDKSDRQITFRINQWAAETYPAAQKHLDAARTLENAIKKRSTH
jgi:putative membrane protein